MIQRLRLAALHSLLAVLALTIPTFAQDDLRSAAGNGDLERVRALLAAGTPVDEADRYGSTALLVAAGGGHLEIVELLLEKGADPGVEESFYHRTPMAMAIGGGHQEVALKLIEAGAVVDNPMYLQEAVTGGQLAVLRALAAKRPFYPFEVAVFRQMAQEAEAAEVVAFFDQAPTTAELRTVEVAAADLARFAGTYSGTTGTREEPGETRTIEIVAAPGGLVAREAGKEDAKLVAIGDDHFRSGPSADDVGMLFGGRSTSIEYSMWVEGSDAIFLRPVFDEDQVDATAAADGEDAPSDHSGPDASGPAERAPSERGPAISWGGFRGPNGSGVADGQGAPTTWDVETGDNVLWKTPIPGLGNSSPVVWGDRVYVTTAVSAAGDRSIVSGLSGDVATTGDLSEQTWMVLALDRRSGEIVWQRQAATATPLTDRHTKSSQANSTPVTDGQHVVAVFPTAGMFCYSRDGELLWSKPLGALNAAFFADESVQWGFANSPILYDGKVILQTDIAEGSFLAAWDVKTGREVWRTDRSDQIATWTTPVIYHGERDELIANGKTIVGYDPKTGAELWRLGPNSEIVIAMPVIGDGLIYVGASYPPVRPLYAVRPGQRGDLSLAGGATSNDGIAWYLPRGGSYMPTPILYDDLLYVGHHQGRLIVYEPATGDTVYRARFSQGGALTGSPVASDGRLYFAMEQGTVYVVRAGREYQELAVNDMKEIVMTTPAISDGALYVRTRTDLYALGTAAASE